MLIPLEKLPLVAYSGMNDVHRRELEILNRLYEAISEGRDTEEISALFDAFVEDIRQHFAYEEDLMRKTAFFAYHCHSEEHKRVLREIEEVKRRWEETKDVGVLKRYFEKVFKPWIKDHILTMDTVTAQWLSQALSGLRKVTV
ncbi:bacteriohemerythrin [Phorcysia thermohydrogeniphila]|uniref:Hemerythrin n=1 Tax=Phorcysia thermohydrogeniphila TaxID=936138 RepID=A0A4R1GE61_9BACT|nr:hemerythrin family protein [Phorcysia thermohydrogeniphila]TCK04029.1 hemerythrin [Phorcysia thermohydrogeniphila]